MRNIFITVGGIAFIGICLALEKLWAGMLYFAMCGVILLALFWAVILSLRYKREFKDEFEENFKTYLAQTINSTSLSSEEIISNRDVYQKKFKKTLVFDKLKQIAIISVLIVVAIICFSIMVSGKLT